MPGFTLGMGLGLGESRAPFARAPFASNPIAALFTAGVNGAWYDPSDMTTLFQDAAGTTPVTAVEQPVGRILDKSGRGNHAFNPTPVGTANFPVLSARYNLLTKTEDFSDAGWRKSDATAPNAYTLQDTATANHHYVDRGTTLPFTSGVSYTFKVRLEKGTIGFAGIHIYDNMPRGCSVDLVTGQIGTPYGGATATSVADGTGWILTVTATAGATTSTGSAAIYMSTSNALASYTGTGTGTILVSKADLRASNDALNQPAYQRVNTATDYDIVGFKPYLIFNGVNQWLRTNSIDFTYGDKMFVSAGVRKLSSSGSQIVAELSQAADNLANNGCFYFNTNELNSGGSSWFLNGTSYTRSVTPAVSVPITEVNSVLFDFSKITRETETIARINGIQQTITGSSASEAGIGPFGNYPLYIGARAGSSYWFNGRLYGLVVAGKQASASEIASTETWLNQKTGAY